MKQTPRGINAPLSEKHKSGKVPSERQRMVPYFVRMIFKMFLAASLYANLVVRRYELTNNYSFWKPAETSDYVSKYSRLFTAVFGLRELNGPKTNCSFNAFYLLRA